MAPRTPQRKARHFAPRAVAALLLALTFGRAAQPARAQIADAVAIRRAADDAAAVSRLLAARAGPAAAAAVMEKIRASCAAREVTRLDDIVPVETVVPSPTKDDDALLQLRFNAQLPEPAPALTADPAQPAPASSGTPPVRPAPASELGPDLARVDKDTDAVLTSRGLELRRGQVRTTGALELARDDIGTIEIAAASSAPGHLLFGWSESKVAPRLRRNNARIEISGDGRLHTYRIDAARVLARGLTSDASVQRIFLATRGDAPLRIESLRVLPRSHRYAGRGWGTAHELRNGELRRVLFVHPAARLAFDVNVPKEKPVFESGLAVLSSDGVLEFEIAVQDGDRRTLLLKRLVRNAPWEDVTLDLGAFAGKPVRLSLAVRGTSDAIALWSSPLLRPRSGADRTEPFVVLLEDALRADRLALYGGPIASPALERLAAAGVVFDRAFAQATQTRPSVPSMMTSLLPSTTGVWDFSDSLSDGFVTLAEALRSCGFATASFLQNGNAGPYAGLAQGFDVVFDEETSGPRTEDLIGPASAFERWSENQQGRPYFAYVHALDPHGPYDPATRPDLKDSIGGDPLLPDRSLDAEWLKHPTAAARRKLYEAEIAANDRAISGLLDRMQARGDLARAVIAAVADHGEFLGEHGGMWRHHPPAHVEVARIPFVLAAPGATPIRVATPVALLDLMPTLLDLAHVDASALAMHGRSLATVLNGGAIPERAIPADEMIVTSGERRISGCGSFATKDALWLRSCTRDSDYSPDRLLPRPSSGPAALRRIGLAGTDFGQESEPGYWTRIILESATERALQTLQEAGVDAWRRTTARDPAGILTEPATSERLRALGYAQ